MAQDLLCCILEQGRGNSEEVYYVQVPDVVRGRRVLLFLAPAGRADASWLSQTLHALTNPPPPAYYYPPPGYNYAAPGSYPPAYGYTYPYSAYPQGYGSYPAPYAVPQSPYAYGNPYYRSYFNDPQWQHDWHEWMEHHPYR